MMVLGVVGGEAFSFTSSAPFRRPSRLKETERPEPARRGHHKHLQKTGMFFKSAQSDVSNVSEQLACGRYIRE